MLNKRKNTKLPITDRNNNIPIGCYYYRVMLCFVELKLNKMKLEKTENKINQEYRDSLMYFNLKRGHTWYDINNNRLYNEYGYCRDTEAKNYLLSIGAIDEQNNKLFQFEE